VTEESPRHVVTFIVRATRDHGGRLRGIVERVKTGEKRRFTRAAGIGGLIERMLDGDEERANVRRRST
jgi:hypothetical protein